MRLQTFSLSLQYIRCFDLYMDAFSPIKTFLLYLESLYLWDVNSVGCQALLSFFFFTAGPLCDIAWLGYTLHCPLLFSPVYLICASPSLGSDWLWDMNVLGCRLVFLQALDRISLCASFDHRVVCAGEWINLPFPPPNPLPFFFCDVFPPPRLYVPIRER